MSQNRKNRIFKNVTIKNKYFVKKVKKVKKCLYFWNGHLKMSIFKSFN